MICELESSSVVPSACEEALEEVHSQGMGMRSLLDVCDHGRVPLENLGLRKFRETPHCS